MEIKSSIRKKEFNKEQQSNYREMTTPKHNLDQSMFVYNMLLSILAPELAKTKFQLEQTKINYAEQAGEARRLETEMKAYFSKTKKQ